MTARLKRVGLVLLGIAAFVVLAIILEDDVGVPFAFTLRIACAAICLGLIAQLGLEYRGERWPWIGLALALLVNVAIFFTPLVDRPTSRGEIMVFALPDAIVVLGARIAYFQVANVHERAVRQQLILALVLAVIFCAIMFFLALLPSGRPTR